MNGYKKMEEAIIVPVVVIENASDAVPAAKALLAGGIGVMEITFRTAAAQEAIQAVAEQCPDMYVGAGTVITLTQCQDAVSAGARFIVSPGFNEEIVRWCMENEIAVLPGCVTPTEIMAALKLGVEIFKFFPAGVYGGLNAMKALSAPFGGIRFVPTGGVNSQNIGEYVRAPFIQAVGGSWICGRNDIAQGNFDKITSLCLEARKQALGFEFAHVGINCADANEAAAVSGAFGDYFGFENKDGNSSVFSSDFIEVMKSPYLGASGHLAIRTNSVPKAIKALEKYDLKADMETAKYDGERLKAVYLNREIGGFAVHLLQR